MCPNFQKKDTFLQNYFDQMPPFNYSSFAILYRKARKFSVHEDLFFLETDIKCD